MRLLLALVLLVLPAPALGNDSMAALGAGGLSFVATDDVTMVREDLFVSADEVRVSYEFRNTSDHDVDTLVAFPLPDIEGGSEMPAGIPSEDPANPFGFKTTFNGAPVAAELHQYAFVNNIDYSDLLRAHGVPLLPYGTPVAEALRALTSEAQQELQRQGLLEAVEYSLGGSDEMVTEYYPAWTLRSSYSWVAHFPAGETVTVNHAYRPSVGGTVAVTFLGEPYPGYDAAADYLARYCTDDSFRGAVTRSLRNPDDPYSAPYTETWLEYVWSTGANWHGPIGTFHLTVDKGAPDNLVSFCWDGEVTKTSPTTFEMEAKDWYPPYGRELDILILNRQNSLPANVG